MSMPFMKAIAGAVVVESAICMFGGAHLLAGDRCVPQCSAPPVSCAPTTGAVPVTGAPGMYAQPPATGSFEGESSGIGFRGPGIQIPELRLQLPTLHTGSLFRFKRGAQLNMDSSAAPFVTGVPAQFGMLSAGGAAMPAAVALPTGGPVPTATGDAPSCTPACGVPPAPASETTSLERRLLEQLIRKDEELSEMSRRMEKMESLVSKIVEQPHQTNDSAHVTQSAYEQPAPLPYTPSAPRASRPLSAPGTGGQKRTGAAPKSAGTQPVQTAEATSVSKSSSTENKTRNLGEWNGAAKPAGRR